mgnify:CR=1 FL=1
MENASERSIVEVKRRKLIILFALLPATLFGQQAMNRPYVDEKLVHFGFSLGVNLMSFYTPETLDPLSGMIISGNSVRVFANEVFHTRVSTMLPGFSVGFITDLRMTRYLSLRFTPQLHFGQRIINYRAESGHFDRLSTDVLSLPITIPLEIKWSAEREGNFRPYIIAGGGFSYNFGQDKKKPILLKPFDYFVQFGAGIDLYFEWFKLCPEIKYQIGFNNVLTPSHERVELQPQEFFYSDALQRLNSHMITIVFNFE